MIWCTFTTLAINKNNIIPKMNCWFAIFFFKIGFIADSYKASKGLSWYKKTKKKNYLVKPRRHLYFRLDIILVKGISKHTLSTYFQYLKIDSKYLFLHACFLPKITRFCTPKQYVYVHYLALKNIPNNVNIFYEDHIQFQIQLAAGGKTLHNHFKKYIFFLQNNLHPCSFLAKQVF